MAQLVAETIVAAIKSALAEQLPKAEFSTLPTVHGIDIRLYDRTAFFKASYIISHNEFSACEKHPEAVVGHVVNLFVQGHKAYSNG